MTSIKAIWKKFQNQHPSAAQFVIFFILSNGITILQMVMMPVFKGIFNQTTLVDIPFQVFPAGCNMDGSAYYVFNYAAGGIAADGTGGGLAYFLAVEISMAIAQAINFFAQREITFKSNSSIGRAAFWYIIAYLMITLAAGAAQGFYKAPIYAFFIDALETGGQTAADIITMIINCAISFWIFFPIFKIIFKREQNTM